MATWFFNHPNHAVMNILKKPIITEKSMDLVGWGCYTFEVDRRANKNQIKEAVEKLFQVDVLKVKTAVIKGRTRKVGRRRREVKGKSGKKALVFLKKGQKIDVFEKGK